NKSAAPSRAAMRTPSSFFCALISPPCRTATPTNPQHGRRRMAPGGDSVGGGFEAARARFHPDNGKRLRPLGEVTPGPAGRSCYGDVEEPKGLMGAVSESPVNRPARYTSDDATRSRGHKSME